MSLRDFISKAQAAGYLRRVTRPVSTRFQLANVAHALDGQPVLFDSVDGYPAWQVLTGVCSDRRYFALALGVPPEDLLSCLAEATGRPVEPPPWQGPPPCQQVMQPDVDLYSLPILHHLPQDGGAYVTSAVVIVEDPEHGRNMAYHRLLRLGKREFAARLIENRGTHAAWCKTEGDLPCAICVGVPLQVNLAAAISPPAGIDEMRIAQALAPTPLASCRTNDLAVPAEGELVLEGRITKRLVREGPFPDLTETMDITREQPVIEIDCVTHRREPIYHALLPGGLEHKVLMGMPREPTIYAEVSQVARCIDVLITPGGASWLHAVVQIEKQGPDDGRRAIEASFRGHGSLKHVVVVDSDINIHDPHEVEWAIATRFQADEDLIVFADQPGSSLDPSGKQIPGKKARTAKMGLDATIPWGRERAGFEKVGYLPVDVDEWLVE
jgi:2,5-furandicarboxylate decarboxylase 1